MVIYKVRTKILRIRLVYIMRLFYSLAIIACLLGSTVSFADTYDALCSDDDCEITINEFSFSGPKGFVPKVNISQWDTGGDEYNLALGAAGGTAM